MELQTNASVSDTRRAHAFLLGFLAGLALVPIGTWKLGAAGGLLGALLTLGCLLAFVRTGRPRRVQVTISATEVVIGARRIARADLVSAEIVEQSPPEVRLEGEGLHAVIEVPNEHEAVELVRALGLVRARPAMWVASQASSVTGIVRNALRAVAIALAVAAVVRGSAATGAVAAALFGASLFFLGRTLRVGDDGVHLDGRLESDFYSYASILRVDATPTGITLRLGAETISLTMTTAPRLDARAERQVLAIVMHVDAQIGRHRQILAPPALDLEATLERGERSFAAWHRGLLRDATSPFREAPLRTEDVRAVLDDPAPIRAPRRLAAALVLAARGDEGDRERIRDLARATAAPKLRVALATIAARANGDDDALERVILDAEREEEELALRQTDR